jgi:hypothetical protein
MLRNNATIADRIYGPYFNVRGINKEGTTPPNISDVVIVNKLSLPLQIYFMAKSLGQDPDTTITPVEEGDYYHTTSAELQLWRASHKGAIGPDETVTVDKKIFSDFRVIPNMDMEIKVMSLATQGVLGFWTYLATDVNNGTLTVTLDKRLMKQPNAIGEPPVPTASAPVPRDSPKLVVGFGYLPVAGNYVVHQQYWRKGSQSYCLAPGEKKTVMYSSRSGMTTRSASVEEISASMAASVSGGYGGITAGLSVALSGTDRVESQQTVSEENSIEIMDVIENRDLKNPMAIFSWELVDLYMICNGRKCLYSFESTQSPTILRRFTLGDQPVVQSVPRTRNG